jgi:hypothetical protein
MNDLFFGPILTPEVRKKLIEQDIEEAGGIEKWREAMRKKLARRKPPASSD